LEAGKDWEKIQAGLRTGLNRKEEYENAD